MRIFSVLFPAAAMLVGTLPGTVFAAGGEAFTEVSEAGPDFDIQGEYVGTVGDRKIGIQVIARGEGKFEAYVLRGGLPGAGWDKGERTKLTGKTSERTTSLEGGDWSGTISDGVFAGTAGDRKFNAKKVDRESPTLGASAPEGATVLFDGSDLDAWKNGRFVEVSGEKYLGVGVRSKERFGDFILHLEFRTPFMPKARGQGRGNSGMYLADQYECQILDSFGLEGKDNECGGIYKISRPDVNMCLPPLSWQTYDVDFTGAKFDDEGNRTAEAVVTIRHNGVVIHEHLKLPHPTPGGGRKDEKPGSLYLQNHSNPVVFRNIWIKKK